MIKVLFFARYAEELGQRELDVSVNGGSTVAQLLADLKARGSSWHSVLDNPNVIISVNQEVATVDVELHAGDEVAFFPPVTGG